MAGCLGDDPDLDLNGDGDDPTGEVSALQAGMELGSVFTGFGGLVGRDEVDPDEPGGGRLITVDDVDPGEAVTLSWRQTVEEEVPPDETPDDDTTPTPTVELVEETGELTASGLADAEQALMPMFWEPEPMTTDSSALWLSQAAYEDIDTGGETPWSPDALTRITWVGDEIQRQIRSAVEDVGEDEVVLEAEADLVAIDLTVDGRSVTVEAIEAHDTFGNEYIVLANAENPLIVEFTYDAVSVGFTGFDTAVWTLIKAIFSGYRIVSVDHPA